MPATWCLPTQRLPFREGDQQARSINGAAHAWLHGAWEITKSPAKGAGLKRGQSFLVFLKGLAAWRSQRHRQMTRALALGAATDETPSRAIGFCVGAPKQKPAREGAGLSLWVSRMGLAGSPGGKNVAASPPTQRGRRIIGCTPRVGRSHEKAPPGSGAKRSDHEPIGVMHLQLFARGVRHVVEAGGRWAVMLGRLLRMLRRKNWFI